MVQSYVEMRFSPSVELIDLVRRFIADFYHRLTDDRVLRDRLAVATHELLENCVRYSLDGEAKVRVEVSPENRLLITVDNAASGHYALSVMTVVAVVFMPIVLIYQGWSFHVFRGRLKGPVEDERPLAGGSPAPPSRPAPQS